jgi:hypothetical protein
VKVYGVLHPLPGEQFRHFGGVRRTSVIDNLRAAVTRVDWYDPESAARPPRSSPCENGSRPGGRNEGTCICSPPCPMHPVQNPPGPRLPAPPPPAQRGQLGLPQMPDESLYGLVGARETIITNQVLIDALSTQPHADRHLNLGQMRQRLWRPAVDP